MPIADWKTPFLRFRDRIRPHFDAGVQLYHGVLMAPYHDSSEVVEAVNALEAAIAGKTLAAEVETPTRNCKHHAHYFFGEEGACRVFARSLTDLDRWIKNIPKGLLPEFQIALGQHSRYRDMAKWACLVYYIAWEFDLPYLQGRVEFQPLVADGTFDLWSSLPQPDGCDPRPLLIHQGDTAGELRPLIAKFFDDGQYLPEIIDAYLPGNEGESMSADFISASLAAVDVLVYMIDQVRGEEPAKQNEVSSSIKKRSSKTRRVSSDTKLLKGFLRIHHDPRETGEKASIPLNYEQIAEGMEWFSNSNKPLQSRVSRRMTEIFGPNPMVKYRSMFQKVDFRKGLYTRLKDGSVGIEAVDDEDED